MKNLILLLSVLSLFLSCGSQPEADTTSKGTKGSPSVESTTTPSKKSPPKNDLVTELPKDYPETYVTSGLPVWDKASIERVNQINNPKAPRYQIILSSTEKIELISAFYSKAMKEQKWILTPSAKTGEMEGRRTLNYKKNEQEIMINILNIPDQEKSIITILHPQKVKN